MDKTLLGVVSVVVAVLSIIVGVGSQKSISVPSRQQTSKATADTLVSAPATASTPQSQTSTAKDAHSHTDNATHKPSDASDPATTNRIAINAQAFTPARITIKRGTAVTWTNNDSAQHALTGASTETESSPKIHSEPLNKGDSYTFTFNEVGTFTYHCVFHPDIEGSIVVE